MPVDGTGMLETPVNGDPARPPRLEADFLRTKGVAAILEDIEILAGENIPVPIEKGAAQMLRQRFERAAIGRIVCVNGIVAEPRANEIVLVRVVQLGPLESRRRVVHPQGLDPGVADVAGIRRSGHARKRTRNRAAIARSEKLPLLQREVREFVNADEEKFGALIAIDVVFVAAKAEARGRAIAPGYDVLGFVVTLVRIARHIAAEIRE